MRGHDEQQESMFSYISPEKRVPSDHPLRRLRAMVDAALEEMSPQFARLYSRYGRPSIAPEKLGSEQEFVNTCVFVGFLSDRLLGPPMPPHLLHVRCRQCFPTFCGSFHVRTWPQLLSGHNLLKGRLKGARPVQNSSSQTATLLVRSHRGGPQILWLEIASGGHPPVNQSLTSASQHSSEEAPHERGK